ncbi:MAG: site-specific DNA-methyltransferase [bacterium]
MATLNFKGKTFVQNHHLSVKYHQLVPKKDKSLTDKVSLNDNLILYGDNLKSLKALLPTYTGKVKCIYIDPPYNTGNERWVYNDNVNSPMMQEWLGKVVDIEDLTRHDKWLCMMMPRLKLLRELLREDGVIFISIDDNEVHRLRMLTDEIFGEQNLISQIITVANKGGQDYLDIAKTHEYILCYGKTDFVKVGELPKDISEFPFKDKEGNYQLRELRNRNPKFNRQNRPNLFYPIYINPNLCDTNKHCAITLEKDNNFHIEVFPKNSEGKDSCWRWSQELLLRNISKRPEDSTVIARQRKDGGWNIYEKNRKATQKAKSVWDEKEMRTELGTRILREIFGESNLQFPKPVELIKKIILLSTEKEDIILDSFAGSGTTAHAVLDLNKEDGGNRKFILVECEDYADRITAERVRRVIKGVPNARDEKLKEGLGGTFSYFELGEPIEMESILEGDKLPTYLELARYVFYTATGEEFDSSEVDENKNFIGESKEYEVYLFYKSDIEYLKSTALTLDRAKNLGTYKGKKRLVFAPSKYLDTEYLLEYRIDYCQLPFEIYKLKE